jgi:hypothetical protein
MVQANWIHIAVMLLTICVSQAFAMEKKEDLFYSIRDFITIDKNIIVEIINNAPNNKTWTPSQMQSWCILAWANYLQGISKIPNLTLAPNTKFYIFSPPEKLANFINSKLCTQAIETKPYGLTNLNSKELFGIVKKATLKNTPILIYTLEKNKVSIRTIIGYNNEQILTFKSNTGTKVNLDKISIARCIKIMNFTMVLKDLKLLLLKAANRNSTEIEVSQELVNQLQTYNFIIFKKPENINNLKFCNLQ